MNQLNYLKERIRLKQEEIKEKLKTIPDIHWEILVYSNTHSKEEVLEKYPEYKDFINKITFNSKQDETNNF